jgi:hypothetical protein
MVVVEGGFARSPFFYFYFLLVLSSSSVLSVS